MARTGQPAERQVGSVRRAIAVLDALGAAREALGTSDIARRTELNASTVSRLLSTLTAGGLVAHDPSTGRYRLGVRLLQLASAARESLDVRSLARPHIEALAEVTGETATLSVPGQHDVITVDFVQSPSSVRSVAEVGRPSVAHATAAGKVFLAYGGRPPEGRLTAYTARTVTDRTALRREAELVRERGWAAAAGEREVDLSAVAAPVPGAGETLVAILGVQGPSGRFGARARQAAIRPLLEHATSLASAL